MWIKIYQYLVYKEKYLNEIEWKKIKNKINKEEVEFQ